MTKEKICAAYQKLIRQAFPRAVVLANVAPWMPFDDVYYVFFIPDNADLEYMERWLGDNGWYRQSEKLGLPQITMLDVNETTTREKYSHLFSEVFGKTGRATSKRSKTSHAAKRAKSKLRSARVTVS